MKTTLLDLHLDRVAFLGLKPSDFYIAVADTNSVQFKFNPLIANEPIDVSEYDCSAVIMKPDGLYVMQAATVNVLDNTFDLTLTQEAKQLIGKHKVKLVLTKDQMIINSPFFLYEVTGDEIVDAPASENFSTQIAQLFEDLNTLNEEVNAIFGGVDELPNLIQAIDTLEQDVVDLQQNKLDNFTLQWFNAELENGWTSNAGTIIQYAKDPFGFVYIRGWMANGVNGTRVFVLPEGYRPTQPTRLPTAYSGYVRINPNGDVIQESGSTVSSPLDPIRFMSG